MIQCVLTGVTIGNDACENCKIHSCERYKMYKQKCKEENSLEYAPVLVPEIKIFTLKDNNISILNSIFGDVNIYLFTRDGSEFDEEITLHDYRSDSLFITLPKRWIGRKVLINYTRNFLGRKLI